MNRLPLGTPNEDAYYSPQQQRQNRALQTHTQVQYVASYQPTLPNELEMPDEWGYPTQTALHISNTPRRAQGAVYTGSATRGASQHHPTATSTVPICRYPNCYYPVTMDERTNELSEYCSGEHMRAAVDLGFPMCPACNTCPRRANSQFCGSVCEIWIAQQEQRLQQERQQRQQQERQQQHQQYQQWQSSTFGSPSMVPNADPVTWSNAARGSVAQNNGSRYSRQG
ncbi:hypothetical protein BC827DRAFT_1196309 [Russula dissimulans]|nr:hypothetical protein BC827DRAFT_1196309 [Russula dissimulans]